MLKIKIKHNFLNINVFKIYNNVQIRYIIIFELKY